MLCDQNPASLASTGSDVRRCTAAAVGRRDGDSYFHTRSYFRPALFFDRRAATWHEAISLQCNIAPLKPATHPPVLMLSRVPPGDFRPAKHHVQDTKCPVSVLPSGNEVHSVCSVYSGVASPTRATVGPLASEDQRRGDRTELPMLRSQYVARGVRVLFGSRWRLNRFQERTIVLRTGAEPTLTVYVPASFCPNAPEEAQPETTYVLALDTSCQLTGSAHSRGVRSGTKAPTATGIQLSNTAATPGAPAFPLRIRFATAADASIWYSIVRETLAHARWTHDVRPVKQEQKITRERSIRVVQHTNSSQRFVLKKLATSNEQEDYHELQILRRLYSFWPAQDEEDVVRGYRVIETPHEMLLIMPQLPGFTLLQFLRQRRRQSDRNLSEDEGWRLLAQLATLLQAVHRAGIVHCDLNLENVLVSHDISRAWLIDFGGAYNLLDGLNSNCKMTGTPGYVAPERVQDPLLPPTLKTDVFSCGVLLFQALTGQHPYLDATREKRPLHLLDSLRLDWVRAQELLIAQAVSPELRNLVGEMLIADPQARISLDKILATACQNS